MKIDTSKEYLDEIARQSVDLGMELGKSILLALTVYLIGRTVIKFVNKVLSKMLQHRSVDATLQTFLKSFVNILLTILLVITVVSTLGINTTSITALLASVGVAVGMALSGNLQNLAGGLIILLFKPFRVGDFIESAGTLGKVEEIQIFHTILLTVDNRRVYLPNGSLSNSVVVNYFQENRRRIDLTIGIEYGEDVEKARRIILNILAANARVMQTPAPVVHLSSLAESSVELLARFWVGNEDYWDAYYSVNEAIYNSFNSEGINFPYPQLTVHQAK